MAREAKTIWYKNPRVPSEFVLHYLETMQEFHFVCIMTQQLHNEAEGSNVEQ